jgi:hypothetical protein
MRRVFVTVLCAASFLFFLPAPAHAWWDWLDELSGPGPFTGPDLQWRIVCIQDPTLSASDSTSPGTSVLRSLESFDSSKIEQLSAAVFGGGCLLQPSVNPVASLNFRVARLWSVDNHLEYSGGTAPRVNVWQYEPSFSTFVDDAKSVEITTGIGWSVFSGDRFESTTRFYLTPVVVTITPGARLARRSRGSTFGNKFARSVSLSTGIVIMPKGFDARDFGAIPGTFHTEREILATASLTLDLSRF